MNKKIISLDLPVKDVYKKVWAPEHGEVRWHNTVKVLFIETNRSGQTVQTMIRLLLTVFCPFVFPFTLYVDPSI